MALKIAGVAVLVGVLFTGALFAYFRKDLDQIRPGELAKRVQTTVTKYYDRNGVLLWEDKGDGNYKLVVESDELSDYLKKATVAIEDRDFYKHHGVSFSGIARAFVNNTTGSGTGNIQGGSTLTQQLVKQVFFAEEAQMRGLSGIPRKIKEVILAIEVERMYNKDQILTLYLNESPYGGRRNGAESGAQTYFGKSAKDLTLAEAALLASIPQNPSVFDPYNVAGHEGLINRQHTVLNYMADQGFITKAQAEEAKQVAILDTIKPQSSQYQNIKAPHFVQMVRAELEKQLGKATVGKGGLSVTTTLDIRIQEKLEAEMTAYFASGIPASRDIGNGAATVEDVQTGQIVALMGSRDFNYPGYGQDNAATAYIQPGSTVKPFVFGQLFKDRGSDAINYGSGSILSDENIDRIYGAELDNWDNRFMGDITIRRSLALSRNIPAVKAMYINGVDETLDFIHEMGNKGYCSQEMALGVGLSSAIGACGAQQVELVNSYASIARMGVYKPTATILEVKNSADDVILKWTDDEGTQVVDPQIPYILTHILSDPDARAQLNGRFPPGLYIPGVNTAGKTGTSDTGGRAKDLWVLSYSPVLSMGLWLGNSDTSPVRATSIIGGPVVQKVLEYAHKNVYAADGKWKPGDWFTEPAGIKRVGNELYPSWWDKNSGRSQETMVFDRVSKYKATDCTPEAARIELEVIKTKDPVTKKDVYIAPDGYDASKDDDRHSCGDAQPSVNSINVSGDSTYTISTSISQGVFPITSIEIRVDGKVIANPSVNGSGSYSTLYTPTDNGSHTVTVTVTDEGFYSSSSSEKFSSSSSGPDQ